MEEQPIIPYTDRIQAARTAYLSIPTHLKSQQESILSDARLCFPWIRIGNFQSEFDADEFRGQGAKGIVTNWQQWYKAFETFIADCDVLIVACDSSRLITWGVCKEIDIARRARKDVVLFKADDKAMRRYWGYERTEKGGRLLKRAEGIAIREKRYEERNKKAN